MTEARKATIERIVKELLEPKEKDVERFNLVLRLLDIEKP